MPDLIDSVTPSSAKSQTISDKQLYKLICYDEFECRRTHFLLRRRPILGFALAEHWGSRNVDTSNGGVRSEKFESKRLSWV
jgi:hypothetical protein